MQGLVEHPFQDGLDKVMRQIDPTIPLPSESVETVVEKVLAGGVAEFRPVVVAHQNRYTDAELMDSIDYTLFPNFHPWGAFNGIVYRFRPNGDDHRSAIMECIMLAPFEGERPPAAKVHWLKEDEKFSTSFFNTYFSSSSN